MKRHPLYYVWKGMLDRCENPNHAFYALYGGAGVKVHEPWRRSFAAFTRDVGARPSPKHTIDRFPNREGNYEPGNVRWATPTEQSRNRRSTVLTDDAVREIRERVDRWETHQSVADRFQISRSMVSMIVTDRTWELPHQTPVRNRKAELTMSPRTTRVTQCQVPRSTLYALYGEGCFSVATIQVLLDSGSTDSVVSRFANAGVRASRFS